MFFLIKRNKVAEIILYESNPIINVSTVIILTVCILNNFFIEKVIHIEAKFPTFVDNFKNTVRIIRILLQSRTGIFKYILTFNLPLKKGVISVLYHTRAPSLHILSNFYPLIS